MLNIHYDWALLRAKAQTHWGILGVGTSFDAQKHVQTDLEVDISSTVDLSLAIEHYQSALQLANYKVNYAFGMGLCMAQNNEAAHQHRYWLQQWGGH